MICKCIAAVVAVFLALGCAAGADDDTDENSGNALGSAGAAGTTPPLGTAGTSDTAVPPVAGTVSPPPQAGTAPPPPPPPAVAGTVAPPPPPTAGTTPPPVAGIGAAGMPPVAGMGEPAPPGSTDPTVPALTAQCPEFRNGTITFMGLGGIALQAGSKASSASAPMIFYWHGTGSVAGEYASQATAVHRGTMDEGGVLISFQGTTGGDLLSGTAIFGAGDFMLTDQLFACAVQNHNVDPRRVFATGCSAGGLFSGAMAASRSSYIAAVAPNSGGWTIPVQFQNDWTPALMTIHGAAGRDVVFIDFSNSSRTADTAFKNRGGFVINCDHGGGHCGGGGLAGSIWEFFKAHPYGTKPSPWTSLPAGFHSSCVIF